MRILSLSENLQAVEITATALNTPPPPGYAYRWPVWGLGLASLSGDERVKAFRGFLGELIQEWMRCGKRVMPSDARVAAHGTGPYEPYSSEWTWTLCLAPKSGYEDGTLVRGKELDPSDPPYGSWLWRVYWDFLHRVKPNIWFLSDGEVVMNYTTPIYMKLESPTALPPFLSADDPNMDCWLEAVLWFMLFLNSGFAQLLDRCTFCKQYFVRKREVKSGQLYKRGGASCGNCKGESSKARTSDIRKEAKGRMLDVATAAWAIWKKSHRTPDRYAAVMGTASTPNARVTIYATTRNHRIETIWVKRNEREIVARVARMQLRKDENQHAKRKD